jgi:hypothetical protein
MAVAAAGWVGGFSPGDYAAFKFPQTPRHDRRLLRRPQQDHPAATGADFLTAVLNPVFSRQKPHPQIEILPRLGFSQIASESSATTNFGFWGEPGINFILIDRTHRRNVRLPHHYED